MIEVLKGAMGKSANRPRLDPIVNMEGLQRVLEKNEPQTPEAYAPPAVRNAGLPTVPPDGPTIEHISKFVELPTKEIDEIIAAAKAEIAKLESDAQNLRDIYAKYAQRLTDDIKRLREGVRISMETLETLRTQCAALDRPIEKEDQG